MTVAQQEQQKYADKFKAQTPKYKIKNKIWLTLENIATATENKKLDAKQAKYTIFENMGSHNFKLNTPPNIRNVFTSIDCVQPQWTFSFPKFLTITVTNWSREVKMW